MQRHRPTGVTILAVLIILGGIGGVAGGIFYVALGIVFAQVPGYAAPLAEAYLRLLVFFGAVLIALGLVSFVMAYGLWKGKRWAYWLAVVFSAVGILFGGVSINLLPEISGVGAIIALIDTFLFLYLTLPSGVREFFGVGRKSIAKMSEGQRKGVSSEIEDMLRVGMTEAEIKKEWRSVLTEADVEELLKSLKATTPKPEEEFIPPQQEFVKREDVIDKEVFDLKGKRVGSVKDIAFTPSGKMGLVISKPDKSEEVISMDNISSMGDIIVLRAPAALETPEAKPTAPLLAQKICPFCKHPNKPEYRYCIRCGKRFPKSRQSN